MTEDRRHIVLEMAGKPLVTPVKNTLMVPTKALANAIMDELQLCQPAAGVGAGGHKKPLSQSVRYDKNKMPLTSLAYTAIDRIEGQQDAIIDALMVYADTDTLSYYTTTPGLLMERQKKEWAPVIAWAGKTFGSIWQTATGIEPAVQTNEMHAAIRGYLATRSAMQLAALSVMASIYSSLVLTLAVAKNHLDAAQAFDLSRLEEEVQAEQWGRDEEADMRKSRVKAEIEAAGRFLRLLEAA